MQKTCLRLLYDRKTGGDIARALQISKSTVESHLAQARRTLGVTRSIEAATLLHDYEAQSAPCELSTYPARLPPEPVIGSIEPAGHLPWWRVPLPFRSAGETHNELGIRQRLVAIVAISIGLAVAFGSLANGVHVVSDLVRRIEYP